MVELFSFAGLVDMEIVKDKFEHPLVDRFVRPSYQLLSPFSF